MEKYFKLFASILILFVLLVAGCKVSNQAAPPPSTFVTTGTTGTTGTVTGATVIVKSNQASVASNALATITATVTDATGQFVADGTQVTFTLDDATKGSLSNGGIATTTNGTAAVTFTPAAGMTGNVIITALSGSKTGSTTLTIYASTAVIAISITASPTSVAAGGTSTITAHVVDNSGNVVADNTLVKFSLDNGLKGILSSATQVTTNGDAVVTFTGGSASTVAVITATVGSATANTVVSITGGTAANILVTASTTSIAAGDHSEIKATVKDSLDNPVSGVSVVFSLSDATKATLSAPTGTSDASGVATVTLTGTAAPFVTVFASALGATSSVSINIIGSASVGSISISAAPASVTIGETSVITALARDASNQPIPAGSTVNFSLSNSSAGTLSAATGTTNASGVASVTFTASQLPTSVSVTAAYSTLGLSSTVNVSITAPPPAAIVATASPAALTAGGTSSITAVVTDATGAAVLDGTTVNFTLSNSSYGSLSNTTSSTSGGTGTATITFTATNKTGSVIISVNAGTITKTITVTISPAPTGSIQFVSASPQVIGIKGSGQIETSSVTFKVYDINGNPVSDGLPVTFALQGPGGGEYIGSTPGSASATASTVNGAATVILNSGSVAGPVTIIASTQIAGGVTISSSATQISIGGGVPSAGHWSLALGTNKSRLEGLSIIDLEENISNFIADRFGNYNILNGTVINFYAEGGAIDRQGITDATGKTSVIFRTQAPYPSDVSNALAGDSVSNLYFSGQAEPWYPGSTYNHNPRDGWVTLLATAMGEEAFLDENADGLFTRSYSASACPPGYTCECDNGTAGTYAGCITSQQNGSSSCDSVHTTCTAAGFGKRSEGFIDLGEPFYDKNDNGIHDDGSVPSAPFEEFIDANRNGVYDGPNGKWDGPSCQSTGCLNSKMIWKDIRQVLTYDVYSFWPNGDGTNCYSTTAPCSAMYANSNASAPFSSAPTSIAKGGSGNFCVNIGDANLNSPPPSTVINASATPGTVTPASLTLLDGLSRGPVSFCFNVAIDSSVTQPNTNVSVSVANSATYASLSVPLSVPPAPSAPTNVLATALPVAGGGGIRVSWTAVSGATSYNIYYSTTTGVTPLNGTLFVPSAPLTASPGNVPASTPLVSGTTYYFVVTAVGAGGEGSASVQASAKEL